MRRWLTLTAFGLIGATAWHAHAEPDEGAKLVSRELMTQGRSQRDAKDFQGALASFSKAHEIMHVPTTLVEVARARADVGLLLEALALLHDLPLLASRPDEPAAFARARSDARALEIDLEQRIPSLQLDLSGSPQPTATTLWLDGALRPDCVMSCRLNPGLHIVTARTRSAQTEEQLRLVERESRQLELVFSPLPAALTPTSSTSHPTTDPAPDSAGKVSPRVPGWTWAWGSIALASVGAGAAIGLSAVSQRDQLRERCAPNCTPAEVDSVRRRSVYSNVAFGIGATAAALAVVSYAF